ncbi:transposase [uncultured Bacteroides sp.]|mgnify:FL=1|uniref:RNA-guided endonuclease InsQ/TnpB family protein n=1 Tax=uncultured Bacteroides sp. TaxID=162156 RepID=UPI0025897FD9|nr:transposase [uncultured Bacteroides sp.]
MYFVKNNPKDCCCERHRINIPTLGWVRLKEKRYLPTTKDGWRIRSKYENLKKMKKGETAQRANIQKQKLRVQKLPQRINQIRTDYINQTIAEMVKTKPSHITIEDLNVKGMMKNRHLSKAVASQKFYEFRAKLQAKCNENGIELRVVDRWYPSSKTCHCCGTVKKDLKLSDRIFKCSCGYVEDRDLNAALNLRDAITYEVA